MGHRFLVQSASRIAGSAAAARSESLIRIKRGGPQRLRRCQEHRSPDRDGHSGIWTVFRSADPVAVLFPSEKKRTPSEDGLVCRRARARCNHEAIYEIHIQRLHDLTLLHARATVIPRAKRLRGFRRIQSPMLSWPKRVRIIAAPSSVLPGIWFSRAFMREPEQAYR